MRVTCLALIRVLTVGVIAQAGSGAFEPQDFNITAALESLGIDVSALPQPANKFNVRSSDLPCSNAVSITIA
jgi:hypothetical protein